ncbi:MAG: hypothetical protein ACO1SV_04635 [Fimbriimonas sp.]
MADIDPSLCGAYLGLKKVREGREDELSPKERKELAKAKPNVDLDLRPDGSFKRQVTEGTWTAEGNRIRFQPMTFGGETLAAMQQRAEENGRMFGLAFVFDPFELETSEGVLFTPDDGSALVTEFRRDW